MPLRFEKITTHKKRFLDLLLLADEQESMIDRYLERGEMFVARDDGQVVAECVVTDEADRIGEIKNLAVPLQYQRKGYGRQMLEFLEAHYRDRYRTLLVGTGDVPRTLRFYERCGYVRSHLIPGFFTVGSQIIVTFAMAGFIFVAVTLIGLFKQGLHFFSFFVPPL